MSTLYSQRDPRWSNLVIGDQPETMGQVGCAITSLAMARTDAGYPTTPDQMLGQLSSTGGLLHNLCYWARMAGFVYYHDYSAIAAPLDTIKGFLAAGNQVLMAVHIGKSTNPYKANHYVHLVDADFNIADPWFNEIAPITKEYGQPAKAILGVIVFHWDAPTPPVAVLEVPAVGMLVSAPTAPEFPRNVTVTNPAGVKVRTAPSIDKTSSVTSILKKGDTFIAVSKVEGGDPYGDGHNQWYKSQFNHYVWSNACN